MSTRRSPRSARVLAASLLLVTAVLAAVTGLVVATVPVLAAAAAWAAVAGVVAARLLSNEVATVRRDWAGDRAALADEHRRTAVVRSREQVAFAEQMAQRVSLRDAQVATLRDALVTAEIELAQARERVSAERARRAALESELGSAQSDLESARIDLLAAEDALTATASAELQLRAELLAWEESATEEVRLQHDRKLA